MLYHTKYFALFTGLLIFPLLSHAVYGERWYNVEVIIFAYTAETGIQEENWADEQGQPDISNTVSLIEQEDDIERLPGQVIEFEELPFEMLSGARDRMQRSSRYNIIYSKAWRLPDLPEETAPPVHIQAGQRFTEDGQIAPPLIIDPTVNPTHNPELLIDDALYEIEGRIKISLSKYLDVDADLLYRRPVTTFDPQGLPVSEFRNFRLAEYRRMKSKTIHYIDHPLFGMVIGIDRYEPEEHPEIELPKTITEINR